MYRYLYKRTHDHLQFGYLYRVIYMLLFDIRNVNMLVLKVIKLIV